jgi:hypothetical protein
METQQLSLLNCFSAFVFVIDYCQGGCCTCCHLLCIVRFLFAIIAVVRALLHSCMGWYQLYLEVTQGDQEHMNEFDSHPGGNQRQRRNYRTRGDVELSFYQSDHLMNSLSVLDTHQYPVKLLVSPDTKKLLISSNATVQSIASAESTVVPSMQVKTSHVHGDGQSDSSSSSSELSQPVGVNSGLSNLRLNPSHQHVGIEEDNSLINHLFTYYDRLLFAWLFILTQCHTITLSHSNLPNTTSIHPAKANSAEYIHPQNPSKNNTSRKHTERKEDPGCLAKEEAQTESESHTSPSSCLSVESSSSSSDSSMCVICLASMSLQNVIYLSGCGHGLHRNCLAQWCAISYDRKHREQHIPIIYTANPNPYLEEQHLVAPLDIAENKMYLHISLSNRYTLPCCPICRTVILNTNVIHSDLEV